MHDEERKAAAIGWVVVTLSRMEPDWLEEFVDSLDEQLSPQDPGPMLRLIHEDRPCEAASKGYPVPLCVS